ncbi:MAG: ubiquitin-like domain-containing protein [Moorellales bacterium]
MKKHLGLVLLGLTVTALAAYGWQATREVYLEVDGQQRAVRTFAGTVEELLTVQGVWLAPEDRVYPGPDTKLTPGLRIQVVRAGPVTLEVAGESKTVLTVPLTVRELLAGERVALGPEDRVEPGLEEVVGPGDRVKVTRVSTREVVENEVLPFATERRLVSYLLKGQSRVVQSGREGLRQRVWRITYVNGQPVDKQEVRASVVRPPVDRIIEVGTRSKPAALQLAARGAPDSFREVREMVATAYSLDNRTATGTRPGPGTVAVDPKVIPLGTRLYVEGYGYGRAEDVGSAIKGNRVDVYFEDPDRARQWGRRRVRVYILE